MNLSKPNPEIIKMVNEGKFPFHSNPILSHKPLCLIDIEFKKCKEIFDKQNFHVKTPMDIYVLLLETLEKISFLEKPKEQFLINLAEETIREVYGVPDKIQFKTKKTNYKDSNFEQNSPPIQKKNIRKEKIDYIKKEIAKRQLLNCLSYGSSLHIWRTIHHLVDEQLNNIHSELIPLYNKYIAIVDFAKWFTPIEEVQQFFEENKKTTIENSPFCFKQGQEQVNFKLNGSAEIESEGINFPLLLHELNKGIIDYLIASGLPQDLNEDEMHCLYQNSDSPEMELWYYFLSPAIWKEFLVIANMPTNKLPRKINAICKLDYENTEVFFKTLINLACQK